MMSLRQKTIWVVGGIFAVLIAGIYLLSRTFLMESYTELEVQQATKHAERFLSAFEE